MHGPALSTDSTGHLGWETHRRTSSGLLNVKDDALVARAAALVVDDGHYMEDVLVEVVRLLRPGSRQGLGPNTARQHGGCGGCHRVICAAVMLVDFAAALVWCVLPCRGTRCAVRPVHITDLSMTRELLVPGSKPCGVYEKRRISTVGSSCGSTSKKFVTHKQPSGQSSAAWPRGNQSTAMTLMP